MKNASKSRLGGFTLIELLVAVLIIGLLAGMALPYYQNAVEMSRAASALAWGRAVINAQDRFYMKNNRYASKTAALDVSVNQCPKGFSCYEGYMVTEQKYEIQRLGGPFSYVLVFSFAFRGALGGKIYCAALRSDQKGVDFCRAWGEESLRSDGTWVRVDIE